MTEPYKQDKLKEILNYEFNSKGGWVTVKFESGWITRRKFVYEIYDYPRKDSFTGKEVPANQVGIYLAIKKKGYTRYWISQTTVNSALAGEFEKEPLESDVPIVKALRTFIDECQSEKRQLMKEDENLREALRELKFKNGVVGKKMSAAHQLLELVSKK